MPVLKSRRMFRGAARGRVFQTVDLGAGMGSYIEKQAQAHPKRKYAAVDPMLQSVAFFHSHGMRMREKGIAIGFTANQFLDDMIRKGWRTRHLNMDMPYPWEAPSYGAGSKDAFVGALKRIPQILLPNGKFYITSESHYTIQEMIAFAKENGFAARETKSIPATQMSYYDKAHNGIYRTGTMSAFRNQTLYRMEITYNLKKAFSSKSARRELSGSGKIISRKKIQ